MFVDYKNTIYILFTKIIFLFWTLFALITQQVPFPENIFRNRNRD